MNIDNTIHEIKDKIVSKFPSLNIYVKKTESEECFILIDDKNIYNTDDFLDLVADIQRNILFPRQIGNISISYRLDSEEISEKFYQIYSAKTYRASSIFVNQVILLDIIKTDTRELIYTTHEINSGINYCGLLNGALNKWKNQRETEYDLAA